MSKPVTTITAKQLDNMTPNSGLAVVSKFVPALNKAFAKFQINTEYRVAAFLAQIAHESGEFTAVKENLNYSAQALRRVFPKYFPSDAIAAGYARKPEAIANRCYANRMGNGPESSGDGYRYRGRGLIQLTGKNNYLAFAKDMKMTLEQAVAYLETTEGAVMSAAWFWHVNGLNAIADGGPLKFKTITQKINGGQNGAAHRELLYGRALSVL